jgi:ribosomal protein L27
MGKDNTLFALSDGIVEFVFTTGGKKKVLIRPKVTQG